MTIDLTTAQTCRDELVRCRREMETIYDDLRRVYTELSADDNDAFEELVYDLYGKMNYTEQQIRNLKSMIRALESIISIYDRTERKNISKAEGLDIVTSDIARSIPVGSYVPPEIADLFR